MFFVCVGDHGDVRAFPTRRSPGLAVDRAPDLHVRPRGRRDEAALGHVLDQADVAAREDACWHRLLPLSMGRLQGDQVVCGYHGLIFNAAGRCTYMPAQKTINPSAGVRAYPTVKRHRLVWLWPGDPALADPDLVPGFHWNDGKDWVGEGGEF